MPDTPVYSWPPMEKRRVMGKRISRVDGIPKATGRAKYSSDLNKKGMLYAVFVTSPVAHGTVRGIDTSRAGKMPGVKAVHVVSPEGTEISWAGTEVVAVAAETEQQARDAARAVAVKYENLAHVVSEENLSDAGSRAKASGEQVTGDVDQAFKEADAISEGMYGIPVLAHCCLEPHGCVAAWDGQKMSLWPTTQFISGVGGDVARTLGIPAAQITAEMEYIGGGFGSKFNAGRPAEVAAQLSKAAGGRPVKLFLDRRTELTIAGVRPSAYAKIKVAGKKDGTLTAWESESWASGGLAGGGSPPIPYVYNIPNQRKKHAAVSLNTGPALAWRAPNHPQASFLTCSAIEDFAAKLRLDPMEVFTKNAGLTAHPDTYTAQLKKAAELSDWKKLWHPRGEGKGTLRRGLGIGVNTWGGAGHQSSCRVRIHPDGGVEIEIGTQDLGTGTRTIITQVAAESLGLNMDQIKLRIGSSALPNSGASGGSTTVGGVSSSTRKASLNALQKLFEAVSAGLGAPADQLEAVDGRVQVKGNPAKAMPWKAACAKLGVNSISAEGENIPKVAPKEGLNSQGVSGIQVADVSVDMETGIVKLNRLVAVQDCGLIINPKTAESQVYGACTMSICGALFEERIMDRMTGRVLNADMEFYKLAGIRDIGEIIVHLDITPEHDKRGVIGLGEPPTIGGIAAIGNAVANAIGVRVPHVPLTPSRVLSALEGRNA